MSLLAAPFTPLNAHQAATPVVIGSSRLVRKGDRSTGVPGRFCFSLAVRSSGFLSCAQIPVAARLRQAFVGAPFRLAPVQTQPVVSVPALRSALQNDAEKTAPSSTAGSNPALNPVRFALWTLRDKAAQRRLALR